MIGQLTDALSETSTDSILCLYGDHVPSMPGVYETLGFNDPRTDYFIWTNRQSETERRNLSVDTLAGSILSLM